MSSLRTVVVIGSNCFTGSHIVDALLDDLATDVVAVSRSPEKGPLFLPYKTRENVHVPFHQIDLLRNSERLVQLLDEVQPQYVINVAALSEVGLSNYQPVEYFQTNCVGVVRLCNQLRTRQYLKNYIHISSAEVYGNCTRPITESAPLAPSTPYAASKAAADMYLLTLAKNFEFPVTLIRSTNVYGRHQQLFKFIPKVVLYLKQRRKIELYGGGKTIKGYVHIRDVVRGVLHVMDTPSPAEIYHFSTTDDHSVKDIFGMICAFMGCDPELMAVPVGDRLGQDFRYWLNWSRATREFAWAPQVPLEQGLKEVIMWVEDNWDEIVGEPPEYVHKL